MMSVNTPYCESKEHRELKSIGENWIKQKYHLIDETSLQEIRHNGYTHYDKQIGVLKKHQIMTITTHNNHRINAPKLIDGWNTFFELTDKINTYFTQNRGYIPNSFLSQWFTTYNNGSRRSSGLKLKTNYLYAFCTRHIIIKRTKDADIERNHNGSKEYMKEIIAVKPLLSHELFRKLMMELTPKKEHKVMLTNIPIKETIGRTPIPIGNKYYCKEMIADVLYEDNKVVIECGTRNISKLAAWSHLGYDAYWLNYDKELYLYEHNKLTEVQYLVE